mmetsp:Transcript_10511/g.26670  ORF Transcript_10511/g.26670 Transcript_10511/m.26670 type:complete len:124 (+) Transcript_10511:234-605(+)
MEDKQRRVMGATEEERLTVELEFVQMLANPLYLNYLAQNEYFSDEAFLNYLRYLKYWQEPKYSRMIIFPQSLFYLELLQKEHFRNMLKEHNFVDWLSKQQYFFWCKGAQESAPGQPNEASEEL